MDEKITRLAERVREVLNYDPETGVFRWRVTTSHRSRVGEIAGKPGPRGIARIGVGRRAYFAHRLAWLYMHGKWPNGVIDHIDGNPGNNRISNLRDVTQQVNLQNQRRPKSNNTTGFLGVKQSRTKYLARIGINGKQYAVGTFLTAEEAHEAYLQVKRKLHAGCTI